MFKMYIFLNLYTLFVFYSYLCSQIDVCSDTLCLTALADVHPQYSYWKTKRRASVLCT